MKNETNDVVLAILKYLEDSMDEERIDHTKINEEALGISYPRFCRILSIMLQEGLITGFTPVNMSGSPYTQYKLMDPQITLKGIDYLQQNKLSTRVYGILKEIKDWIPGI